jgi:hypothetical protein
MAYATTNQVLMNASFFITTYVLHRCPQLSSP